MAQYNPPLRDMQFVLHELLNVTDELRLLPKHADIDADTINAVLEEGGKFTREVTFPLNISGDEEGCILDKCNHEVRTPTGFKEAYAQYVQGGWPSLSCDPEFGGQGLPIVLNQCFYEMTRCSFVRTARCPTPCHKVQKRPAADGMPEQ